MRPDDEIWRKWNRAASDPIGDIDELFKTIRVSENIKPFKVFITKGSSVGRTTSINVGTIAHCMGRRGASVIQSMLATLHDQQRELLNDNNEFKQLFSSIHNDARRYYMLAPEPMVKSDNNKPWYQDRKFNRNKKIKA
jgi:hypothetical protein